MIFKTSIFAHKLNDESMTCWCSIFQANQLEFAFAVTSKTLHVNNTP